MREISTGINTIRYILEEPCDIGVDYDFCNPQS